MRSLILFACAAAGVLGGGALISLAALGGCLIFVSLAVGVYASVTYDWPEREGQSGQRPHVLTLEEVFDRARAS